MSSTRIKGVALTLKIGATDYMADISACTITNEAADSGVVTFADAASGGARQFFLNVTGIQSTDTDSLWSYIWQHSGETVAFDYAPHGNAEPTEDKPHFTGNVKIGPKPTIGGEAGSGNTYSFETQWEIEGEPDLDRGEPEEEPDEG